MTPRTSLLAAFCLLAIVARPVAQAPRDNPSPMLSPDAIRSALAETKGSTGLPLTSVGWTTTGFSMALFSPTAWVRNLKATAEGGAACFQSQDWQMTTGETFGESRPGPTSLAKSRKRTWEARSPTSFSQAATARS